MSVIGTYNKRYRFSFSENSDLTCPDLTKIIAIPNACQYQFCYTYKSKSFNSFVRFRKKMLNASYYTLPLKNLKISI